MKDEGQQKRTPEEIANALYKADTQKEAEALIREVSEKDKAAIRALPANPSRYHRDLEGELALKKAARDLEAREGPLFVDDIINEGRGNRRGGGFSR